MEMYHEPQQFDTQPMTTGEKLVNIITSPSAVFANIRERISWQDWVIPFLVAVVVSGAVGILNAPYTLEFSKKAMRAQQERFLSGDVSQEQQSQMKQRFEEQMQNQEERYTAPKVYYWSFGRTLVGIGISVLILASLYYFAGNTILGGEAPFEKVLTVVALPQMVKVIESVYNAIMTPLLGTAEVPASLAALLPYGAAEVFSMERYHQAVFTLLSQINVFTVWRLVLFTIGLMLIYRISKGKAVGVVFGYWAIWLVITTAGSFFLSGLA